MNQGIRNVNGDGHPARPRRTGTVWTASANIVTVVMAFGVLSSSWDISQLGWIAGPVLMLGFSFVTYYTSTLLAAYYRSGDSVAGQRNYTYTDVVRTNLGDCQAKLCGAYQYLNLFGGVIEFTISSSLSMKAIQCFHSQGGVVRPCKVSTIPYRIAFGVVQILVSQIANLGQIWWISIVSAVMSLIAPTIGLCLGAAKILEAGEVQGNLTGLSIGGTVTGRQKIFRSFQAIGSILFAYSHSLVLIEIQDTIESPPSEYKTMKRATRLSVIIATIFYMLCGCVGYAAFGDFSPDNLLAGFDSYKPYGLLGIANAALVIQNIGAYQVCCQPIFAFIENTASKEWFPQSKYSDEASPGFNLFRLVWRCIFVIITTIISVMVPSFSYAIRVLGSLGLWRLTVHYPVAICISQEKIPKWRPKWICLHILSKSCLLISLAAVAASLAEFVYDHFS